MTFKNSKNNKLSKIELKSDDQTLENEIKEILKENPRYEVYNIMNTLFGKTIQDGYLYKVSKIVKICAKLMR